jgi:hypothetical protein
MENSAQLRDYPECGVVAAPEPEFWIYYFHVIMLFPASFLYAAYKLLWVLFVSHPSAMGLLCSWGARSYCKTIQFALFMLTFDSSNEIRSLVGLLTK